MKIHTRKNHLIRRGLALAIALAVWSPGQLQSASHMDHEMKMDDKIMEKCEVLKKEKQEMQAKMKAQDAELIAAVATLNNAAQGRKLDLMAGIVTQLVEQRAAMHIQNANMQEKMMKHMMGHMEMAKESIANCPMMKDMKGMDDKKAAVTSPKVN